MRKMLFGVLAAIPFVLLAGAGYMRTVSHDTAEWHVDPLTAPKPTTPNSYRLLPGSVSSSEELSVSVADGPSPVWDLPVAELAERFKQEVLAEPGVTVLAESTDGRWITYVQTTRLIAFPDYISVKFVAVDDQRSTIAIFSRSRFGQSDLGVNAKRVKRWINLV